MRQSLFAISTIATLLISAPALAQHSDLIPERPISACRPLAIAAATSPAREGRRINVAQIWGEANTQARQRPERGGFEAARYVYTYAPGAIYELNANPNFISAILSEAGETVHNLAAGDTSRWQVEEANSADTDGARTVLLVKPAAIGLRTNIVIVTNRRTYLVEALSQGGDIYSAEIAWCYANDVDDDTVGGRGALNFDYHVRTIRGARPIWTPVRVYDDGRRTWIEFTQETEASDLPPLFVLTGEGTELVNYRLDGRRYVVDRVFDRAELRLGVRAPQIVRIERANAISARPRSRRGRP